ncbi:hypothetical protein O181_027097 [Austropuccinia psidii MF-1]|uniref:Nuclear pore complex protein Nup85 n=1 Tax=Austropuccinia psidii MF-1 TaxID=1389203 RepID=A0A9Q3CRY1_9BASI|nr:hypothetical protein [Austropuccinia psidii MF-1]
MPPSINLFPKPITLSHSSDPQNNHQRKICHAIWDPKRNALALAVVPSHLASRVKSKQSSRKITSVPDQSLYLVNALDFKLTRRTFITRSFEIFTSLQKVVQACEDEDEIPEAQVRLSHGPQLPLAPQLKYYSRIGNQYVAAMKDYLAELEKEDPDKNSEEIDLVLQMIEAFSLFVLVYVPVDGRGDGIVSEQILDWVNRSNPQPPREEGEELSALLIPFEHVNFWPYIHACIIRGHLSQATALLKSYTKTHNPTLNQLMVGTISMIKSTPRSTQFNQELEFSQAIDQFRENIERSLMTLESEMNVIFESEAKRSNLGNAFDEDDLIHFQASYKILLEILSGDEERISEACYDWREALGAHLLWVDPLCKRDDLPLVMKKVTKEWPIDQTSNLDLLTSSLLTGDISQAVKVASTMDKWLICHLVDLIHKLGISLPDHSREHYIYEFVDYLSVDHGLWRLMVAYLATVDGSKEWIREILRRLIVEDLGDQTDDTMQVESLPAKTTTKVSMLEIKMIYREYGLEDELTRLSRIMSRKLIKERKYGTAIAYAVTARDLKMVSKISDCLLDEYLTNGPEEFARLVDEIPSSLLHPTAAALRPGLFFDLPNEQDANLNSKLHPNLNSSKLLFISRYRDMHSYYSRGERKLAAETLIGLLTGEIAPKPWWAVCLIDVIPLLEDDEMLISLADTYELLRCLEEIVGPILANSRDSYDNLRYLKRIVTGKDSNQNNEEESTRAAIEQLNVVRYALSRHLARSLTSKH